MNTASANIMVAAINETVCVQISGKANFTSSLDLKKLADEMRRRGSRRFVFDLTDCSTMDSTFLGVLSGIALIFGAGNDQPDQGLIELINPNPRIQESLENLGVAQLFNICACGKAATAAEEFRPVEHQDASKLDVTRACLEAHNLLIEINPENESKFKDVTRFLAENLKQLESADEK